MPQNGLKIGSFHPFVHPKWSRMSFEKMRFGPIFDPFLVPKQRIFKAFWELPEDQNGPPQAQNGPKTLALASHMV